MKINIKATQTFVFIFVAAFLTACATPTVYSWGKYEEIVYDTYNNPGNSSPEKEIAQMEKDYQEARSNNQPVHPGFHAHLGYLYYQVGKFDAAQREFETEKKKFPESSVFMDRLLAKLKK